MRLAVTLAVAILFTLAWPSRLAAVDTYQSVGTYAIPSAFNGGNTIIGLEVADEQLRLFGLSSVYTSPLYSPADGLSFSSNNSYPPAIRFSSFGVVDAVPGTSQVALVASAPTQSPRLFIYDLATQQNTAALSGLASGTLATSVAMDSSGTVFMLTHDASGLQTVYRYSNISLSTSGTLSPDASFTLSASGNFPAFGNLMALGPDGMLYILEPSAYKVARYDPSGTLLGSFDVSIDSQALAVGPNGTIYVVENENSYYFINGYTPSGELLGKAEVVDYSASLTSNAQSSLLTVDDQGTLYLSFGKKPSTIQVFSTVPEPATTGLLALGLCLGAALWRGRKEGAPATADIR